MMTTLKYIPTNILLALGLIFLSSCGFESTERFEELSPEQTGVEFVNDLEATPDLNIFNYLYFYDGGGVAAGDLNGDDLPDLFFTANQGPNKLFINKSDMQFQDVTKQSFDTRVDDWSTGVTLVDINDDGRLDIYVSNLGSYLKVQGENKLFINQGNNKNGIPVFKEQAKEYGLDLVGFSTQAAFFDYDLDGDLDMYMMNHSVHSHGTFNYSKVRDESHPLAGDKLLRNDNGTFVEVTEQAGIYNSALGYGLGIGISDINQDGYPDIYIGNDFHEDDYLYINNGDGTFTESLGKMMRHTSRSSMGNDLVDINNDGLIDIFSLDMLPEDYEMLKASAAEDPLEIYKSKLRYGYKYQFSRNTLQLNRGDNKFSEIGMLSGVHATDWSWAALGADFSNNGHTDLFVSNGIKGRTNDLDYISYISQDHIQNRLEGEISPEQLKLTDRMPAVKVSNYMFQNNGSLVFQDVTKEWGLDKKTFSGGAAYADLDADGDLDIVVNNVDQQAQILKNKTREKYPNSNYLKLEFNGPEGNQFGIGTKVTIPLSGEKEIFRELYPTRGYLSSIEYGIHVGVDTLQSIDKLHIQWPDGRQQSLTNVATNQTVTVDYEDAVEQHEQLKKEEPVDSLFTDITNQLNLPFKHKENGFVEFNREALIPHMVSKEGPALAVGDVNGDGLEDLFVGGAKRQPSHLFVQSEEGSFSKKENMTFSSDSVYEDVDATFEDFDADDDLDLLVVSGGNEYYGNSQYMQSRLYINNGKGEFVRDMDALPDLYMTGSVVAKSDVDNDGDTDLFLGARAVPWNYGKPPTSYLLINENGRFKVDKSDFGNQFSDVGLVTDAQWSDMDGNGKPDLVITSEWSNIKIIYDDGERLEIPNSSGLWNTVKILDIDSNGQPDIVAGNLGLNSKYKASSERPMKMYINDYDDSGSAEQIITYRDDENKERLVATKDELGDQLNYFNDRFKSYQSFAEASLTEVVDQKLLDEARTYSLNELRSSLFLNLGDRTFKKQPLPIESQFTPLYNFVVHDFNEDNAPDILTAGNFFEANIQRGRYDAGYGSVLLNSKKGGFHVVPNKEINWFMEGQIRNVEWITVDGNPVLIFAQNNGPLQFFKLNKGFKVQE